MQVFTFYSYKGGVGRSMALANVAALLSRWRYRVLLVDWDLEAPGIEKYFEQQSGGRLAAARTTTPGVVDLVEAQVAGTPIPWQSCLLRVQPSRSMSPISIISAGRDDTRYTARLQAIDWNRSFEEHGLGTYLEQMREEWRRDYHFVLVDSRTGITDIGGICTIHLPDVLVMFFTTNRQSLDGTIDVLRRARQAHVDLPFDRSRLVGIPVPARDESRTEFQKAAEWRQIFARDLSAIYEDWLPKGKSAFDVLDKLRVPYIPFWSFGERLPVLEEGSSDPQSIGFAYEILARLIVNKLDWQKVIEGKIPLVAERVPASIIQAAEAYVAELPAEEQEQVRRVLLRLVRFSAEHEGGAPRRVRMRASEFSESQEPVLRKLTDLMVIDVHQEADGADLYELSSDEILEKWDRFSAWIQQDREQIAFRDQLRAVATVVLPSAGDGSTFAKSVFEQARRSDDLSPSERAVVEQLSSIQRRSRRRFAVAATGAALIVVVFLATLVLRSRSQQKESYADRVIAAAAASKDPVEKALLIAELSDYPQPVSAISVVAKLKESRLPSAVLHATGAASTEVMFAANESRVVGTSIEEGKGWVRSWDLRTGEFHATGVDDASLGIYPSPTGQWLVKSSGAGLALLPMSDARPGQRAAAGDGTISLVSVTSLTPPSPMPWLERLVVQVSWDGDGTRLLTSHDRGVDLLRVSGEALKLERTFPEAVVGIFAPAGRAIVLLTSGGELLSIDPKTLKRLRSVPICATSRALAFSLDGTQAAIACSESVVQLLSLTEKKLPLVTFRHVSGPEAADGARNALAPVNLVAFSGDGRKIASVGADSSILVRDAATLEGVQRYGAPDALAELALSGNGRMVVSRSRSGELRLFGGGQGEPELLATGCNDFSMGRTDLVVAAMNDGSIRIWNLGVRNDIPAAVDRFTKGPSLDEQTWTALTTSIRSATSACLTAEQRVSLLSESADVAGRKQAECEGRMRSMLAGLLVGFP